MKRRFFFWIEKLRISRTERRALIALLGILVLLTALRAAIPKSRPWDEEKYRELDRRFKARTALLEREWQQQMSRYEGEEMEKSRRWEVAVADTQKEDSTSAGEHPRRPVDLNRAGPEVLQRLPGIGPAYARRIIRYRNGNGGFRTKDELLKIRGIGPARLDKLRPLVVLGPVDSLSRSAHAEHDSVAVPNEPLRTEAKERININTADAAALQQLRGIGPAYAARIVAYRRKHGAFRQIEDLLNIKGIGEKRLAKIKPFIKLTGHE